MFIDAVNESVEIRALELMLQSLASGHPNLRLFVTSTDSCDHEKFKESKIIQGTMDMAAVDADIATYLGDQMATNKELSSLNSSLRSDVREAILAKSKGV